MRELEIISRFARLISETSTASDWAVDYVIDIYACRRLSGGQFTKFMFHCFVRSSGVLSRWVGHMRVTGNIDDLESLDFYRSRLRILFILYYFSQPYEDANHSNRVRIFETELRIQKIDFLLRNPDYLCYEILSLVLEGKVEEKIGARSIVERIFKSKEPVIRKQEMERFFFGAFEDLDDIVAFLKAYNFIEFESERNVSGNVIGKKYYVTQYGEDKIKKGVEQIPCFSWYQKRCMVIHKFFGGLSGTELKVRQYQIQKYRETPLNQYIEGVERETEQMFQKIYGAVLV